jgi:hypothetical protein
MTAASAALVKDGKVDNVIVVDINENRETEFEYDTHEVVVLPDGSPVMIGYSYSDGNFTAPDE